MHVDFPDEYGCLVSQSLSVWWSWSSQGTQVWICTALRPLGSTSIGFASSADPLNLRVEQVFFDLTSWLFILIIYGCRMQVLCLFAILIYSFGGAAVWRVCNLLPWCGRGACSLVIKGHLMWASAGSRILKVLRGIIYSLRTLANWQHCPSCLLRLVVSNQKPSSSSSKNASSD